MIKTTNVIRDNTRISREMTLVKTVTLTLTSDNTENYPTSFGWED